MDGELAVPDDRGARAARAAPDAPRLDLSRLTPGERLWLWRHSRTSSAHTRRHVSVHSEYRSGRDVVSKQMEAAEKLGVSASVYWAAENDRLPEDEALRLLAKIAEPLYQLRDALRIARRRSHLRLEAIALGVGVGSRPTLYKLEAAGDSRVTAFWRSQGFRFPRQFPCELR